MNNPTIVHPCDAWSRSAGRADWNAAVAEMKAGAVIAGRVPVGEKSMLGLQLLMERVEAEGMHIYVDAFGTVVLGLKKNFPQDILAAQDREIQRLASRMAHS